MKAGVVDKGQRGSGRKPGQDGEMESSGAQCDACDTIRTVGRLLDGVRNRELGEIGPIGQERRGRG